MCFECDEIDKGKRTFLKGATAAFLGAALNSQTLGQQTASATPKALDNPNIVHQAVTFQNGADIIKGYLARPKKNGRFRAVVVAQGNPGMPEDIRNAAAQMAELGYVGLAVDWNSRATGGDTNKLDKPLEFYINDAFNRQNMRDTQAAIDYLQMQSFVKPKKVGMLGFCGGGYLALRLATLSKDIKTVVAFYAPPLNDAARTSPTDPRPDMIDFVGQVKVPAQYHFGTRDRVITLADIQKFEQKLKTEKAKAEIYLYEGAGHAFYDYTRPNLHNPAAAQLAYERMRDFLKKQLG
ncbi:MAG TPA: dienelactone hydrolase family protein [Pyrinomonadaceae bacterium]|jgi:carboxymethylenebutenolidase